MENDEVLQIIAMHDNEASVCLPRKIFTGELERYLTLGVFKRTNNFLYEINCPGGCGEMATVTKTLSGKYIATCGHTDRPMEDFEIPPEEVELYRLDRVTFDSLCEDGTIDFDPYRSRAHADNNNSSTSNSMSPKGTCFNNNSKYKNNIPRKGGGKWQTGPGKKMIDEFLEHVDKNQTSPEFKELAQMVWCNKAHAKFVEGLIDNRKRGNASAEAFEDKFYPACMRAIKKRKLIAEGAKQAQEQSRESLVKEIVAQL